MRHNEMPRPCFKRRMIAKVVPFQVQRGTIHSASDVRSTLADLTVSKRPGTSGRTEIHFAVFNHLYLCLSFMKLAETL